MFKPVCWRSESTKESPTLPRPAGSLVPRAKITSASGQSKAWASGSTLGFTSRPVAVTSAEAPRPTQRAADRTLPARGLRMRLNFTGQFYPLSGLTKPSEAVDGRSQGFPITAYRDRNQSRILGVSVPRQPATWLHVSGYRFQLRRLECALLRVDTCLLGEPLRARTAPLPVGCALAAIALAGSVFLALPRPEARLDQAQIVMGKQTGALYVRVGDTWHPVLNLASARLIAGSDATPQPVRESQLSRTKRGPLLGIPGAPQFVGPLLCGDESAWAICDTDGNAATTVLVEPAERLSA